MGHAAGAPDACIHDPGMVSIPGRTADRSKPVIYLTLRTTLPALTRWRAQV